MCSISPLRYLVVTWERRRGKGQQSKSTIVGDVGMSYRFVALVEIVYVSIQDLDEELDGRGRLHARVGHAESA